MKRRSPTHIAPYAVAALSLVSLTGLAPQSLLALNVGIVLLSAYLLQRLIRGSATDPLLGWLGSGLSCLGFVIATGLILNETPGGLSRRGFEVFVDLAALVVAGVALLKRPSRQHVGRTDFAGASYAGVVTVVLVAAGLVMAVTASLAWARSTESANLDPDNTSIYLTNPDTPQIIVANAGHSARNYLIVDSTGGKRSSVRIALDAGAKWHVRVYSSPASRAAKPTKSRITLIDENTGRTLGSVALNGISVDLAGGR